MSDIRMVESNGETESKEKLQLRYDSGLIPAEKKPFLSSVENAFGPFICTEKGDLILDASSQIATMALGFSATALHGVVHHLESWTNREDTDKIRSLRNEFTSFLSRKTGWNDLSLFICNSGSEANEIALGECYRTRKNPQAKKVLAFEGSFHGRMLLALASTWNPAKREQYEWPDYTSCFVNFPEMKGDLTTDPGIPDHWIRTFARSSRVDFEMELNNLQVQDGCHAGLFELEKSCLLEIRQQLLSGEIFAILIEPIQCEGGDRYSSKRFQIALANMAKAFQVPLIYDEVQTGFGLGGDFFWYQLFDLQAPDGTPIYPDFVVCAKKAQVGLVLSHEKIPFDECYSVQSFIRGCLQGWMIDQLESEIFDLEGKARVLLENLVAQFADHLHSPRARGMSFSFDFHDKEALKRFIACRFEYGMLYYPAGTHTARFRLNTSFKGDYLELLFAQLIKALKQTFCGPEEQSEIQLSGCDRHYSYDFHLLFSKLKLDTLISGKRLSINEGKLQLDKLFEQAKKKEFEQLSYHVLNSTNYADYREQIDTLQLAVYEPVRQSSLQEFDKAILDCNGFGVVILDGDKLVGLSVCCPLETFGETPGVRQSVNYETGNSLYSMDITLDSKYRGASLGKFLKYAQLILAVSQGYQFIEGRNRDRLASQMLTHNFAVGALPSKYLLEDYKDSRAYRDCIYYQTDLEWKKAPLNLSKGVRSPWGMQISRKHLNHERQGVALNKMCLSNFLSNSFLLDIELISKQFPLIQRHLFTASGQSECLDKAIKTIWKFRKVQRILCMENTYFGHGSFAARSLALPGQQFYPVDFIPDPSSVGEAKAIEILKQQLSANDYLAFCVEPLMQKSLQRLSLEFLNTASEICSNSGVPIISNDTASAFNRYSSESFSAGPLFNADISILFLGGQMGLVMTSEKWFVSDPLALISTWDGDEHTLRLYAQYLRHYLDNQKDINRIRKRFSDHVKHLLNQQEKLCFDIHNGFGWIQGPLEYELARLCDKTICDGRYLLIPDDDSIAQYMEEHGS